MKKTIISIVAVISSITSYAQQGSAYYTGNLQNAAFGWGFDVSLHNPKLQKARISAAFVDIKSDLGTLPEERVDEWVLASESSVDYYSYGITDWGSYINESTTQKIMLGEAVTTPLILNAGVGINLSKLHSPKGFDTQLNIGVGISRQKHSLVQETSYYYLDIYNFEIIDFHDTYSDYSSYTKVVAQDIVYSANFSANLVFKGDLLLFGIGFDTAPKGVNLLIGFTF